MFSQNVSAPSPVCLKISACEGFIYCSWRASGSLGTQVFGSLGLTEGLCTLGLGVCMSWFEACRNYKTQTSRAVCLSSVVWRQIGAPCTEAYCEPSGGTMLSFEFSFTTRSVTDSSCIYLENDDWSSPLLWSNWSYSKHWSEFLKAEKGDNRVRTNTQPNRNKTFVQSLGSFGSQGLPEAVQSRWI